MLSQFGKAVLEHDRGASCWELGLVLTTCIPSREEGGRLIEKVESTLYGPLDVC